MQDHLEILLGAPMSYLNDVQETKVFLALAAWRSYERLRREADFWENLVEQRTANLSEEERKEFFTQRSSREQASAKSGFGFLFQRPIRPR